MRSRFPRLGSFLLGLVLFYLFFLWQFPYAQLKKAMVQGLEVTFPLTVSIGQVSPSLPASLRIVNIGASSDSLSFRVPDLMVNPRIMGFFLGKTDLTIGDSANSSRLTGRFWQEKNKNQLNLRLNQMEVRASSSKEFSFLMKLSGEVSLQWEGGDWEKGTGQAWALLERAEIQGAQVSQAPLPLTLFDTLRAEVQLRDGLIRVKRLEASGKDTRFSLPRDLQFPLKGGRFPLELGLLLQPPPK